MPVEKTKLPDGREVNTSERFEQAKPFANKLWNAARFCEVNECAWVAGFDPSSVKHIVNQWIVGEVKLAADKVASLLDDYRFDLASSTAYDFVWNNFCDWYLEFTKPIIGGTDEVAKAETRATTAWVLGQMLHILHPFMPYITEELWTQFIGSKDMLISAKWPVLPDALVKKDAQNEINWLIKTISAVRTVRAELNVPGGAKIRLEVKDANAVTQKRLQTHSDVIEKMMRLSGAPVMTSEVVKGAAQTIVDEATLILPLADVIDLDQERARLAKESAKWEDEIRKVEVKLANKDFVDRAPPEVLEEHNERKANAEAMIAKLAAAQKSLAV